MLRIGVKREPFWVTSCSELVPKEVVISTCNSTSRMLGASEMRIRAKITVKQAEVFEAVANGLQPLFTKSTSPVKTREYEVQSFSRFSCLAWSTSLISSELFAPWKTPKSTELSWLPQGINARLCLERGVGVQRPRGRNDPRKKQKKNEGHRQRWLSSHRQPSQ